MRRGSMYGVLLLSDGAGRPLGATPTRLVTVFLRAASVVSSSGVRMIWKSTYFSGSGVVSTPGFSVSCRE